MKRRLSAVTAALGLVALSLLVRFAQSRDVPPDQPPGAEVQARGPVHEAFAQPLSTQPEQGAIVTKPPPDPIDEVPPDEKPDGDDVQWIPGYWAYDDDASDFVWVSGFWRAVPPGRRWMPGHWQEIDKGWLWVAGFWATEDVQEVQYLPEPPPTIEKGPSTPAPDDNSNYVAGCWVYQDTRYLWRPGHWTPFKPNWVSIPARYVWTPIGCLFVDGYWDHPLDERGLLFAPVRFDLAVWRAARQPFVPSPGCLQRLPARSVVRRRDHAALLLRRLLRGAATEASWPGTIFIPAPARSSRTSSYYRHLHAAEPKWEPALRELYRGRRSGEGAALPHTLAQQVTGGRHSSPATRPRTSSSTRTSI